MKKIILPILFTCLVSTASFANNGAKGFVQVTPDSFLSGTMNIRFNDDRYGSISANITERWITFVGVDDEFDRFSCSVPKSSEMYEYARDIANNLTDGSQLIAHKTPGVHECTYLSHSKLSSRQQ